MIACADCETVNPDTIAYAMASLRSISDASNAGQITLELGKSIEPFGFTSSLVTGLPMPHEARWHDHVRHNGWPAGWYLRYNQQRHYRFDPCAERCRNTATPFLWSDLGPQSVDGPASVVMQEAGEFGLRDGLCVPIHLPFSAPAAVSLAGDIIEVLPETRPILHLLAWHAFHALAGKQDMRSRRQAKPLTKREREILQWAGAGKSAWEISCILSISFHTVNAHLRNARRKMGTANVTHSVVEALRAHQIQL